MMVIELGIHHIFSEFISILCWYIETITRNVTHERNINIIKDVNILIFLL